MNVSGILKAPIQKVLSSAVNWFDSMYGYLYEYDSLMAENESLRSQLADAQKSARDGIEASEENNRLRKLLDLREKHTDYVMESCKVVLWSSSNWSSAFTISKGSTSGIELGDAVITEYGAVVGQITELGSTWATVSTVIDVDMSVGAFVGATGRRADRGRRPDRIRHCRAAGQPRFAGAGLRYKELYCCGVSRGRIF